jgi:hypothetical protein
VLSFFSFLSLTCGTHALVSLLSSSSPFSLRPAPHHADRHAPRPCARMGRPGRRAGTQAELTRAPMTQSGRFRKGEFPLLPSAGDAKGARAATGGWPRRHPGVASNWGAPATDLPLHRLDRDPKGDPGTLAAPHRPTWGFPPFPVCAAARGKVSGGGEEGVVRRVAADVPLLGVVRGRVEPTGRRAGRGTSASSGRPEQRRKQSAAVYVYPALPPLSGRRRLHYRPNMSQTVVLPSFVLFPYSVSLPVACLRVAGCRCTAATPMCGRRPAPSLWRRHTVATPGCPCEHVLVLRPVLVGPRFIL